MIIALVCLIMIICLGLLGTDGLWHNIVTFFNVLIAAILTMNFFEPLGLWLDSNYMPSFTFTIDLLAFWGLFAVIGVALRIITGLLSKVRVRFIKPVDRAGGMLVSLGTGWILVSLTLTSLHLAPLPLNSFNGEFQPEPNSKMFFELGPDRKWLGYIHNLSKTTLSRTPLEEQPEKYIFDPKGMFILKYGQRRKTLETLPEIRVDREWGTGKLSKDDL